MSFCFGNDKCETRCNEQLGRYVVASKDLKAGDLLLTEAPTVIGPYWDSKLCCLNCFDESMRMCKKCKIATLCLRCTGHDPLECTFLASSNLPPNILLDHFDLLTPLRCVMLARDASRREQFEELSAMESHCDQRRDTEIWRLHQRKVVEPLQLIPGFLRDTEDADWLQRICGILDVNAFEVRTANFTEIPVRGLYARAALLPHDCVGNTFITVDGDRTLRIYACVDIPIGETVFNNYTSTLFGTVARQEHLREGKYFQCQCARCLDPTELQTHLSSITCQQCQGMIVCQPLIDQWMCMKCSVTHSNESIRQRLRLARTEIYSLGMDLQRLDQCIAKYSLELNPTHYLVLEMKQKCAAVLRNLCEDNGKRLTSVAQEQKLLWRKVELCQELLPVLRVLKPGISRLTAIALFEQFTAIFRLAQIRLASKAITSHQYLEQLIIAERYAKESVSMLVYEPPSTPEGDLGKHGMQQLRQLRTLIGRQQQQKAHVRPHGVG